MGFYFPSKRLQRLQYNLYNQFDDTCQEDGSGRKYEDKDIKGTDTELDVYSVSWPRIELIELRVNSRIHAGITIVKKSVKQLFKMSCEIALGNLTLPSQFQQLKGQRVRLVFRWWLYGFDTHLGLRIFRLLTAWLANAKTIPVIFIGFACSSAQPWI